MLRVTALTLAALPLCAALRSNKEGLMAWMKRPGTVLAGQVSHVLTLCPVSALALYSGVRGHLMGPVALVAGNLAAGRAISLILGRRKSPLQEGMLAQEALLGHEGGRERTASKKLSNG